MYGVRIPPYQDRSPQSVIIRVSLKCASAHFSYKYIRRRSQSIIIKQGNNPCFPIETFIGYCATSISVHR